jgi:bisanhydrobacterioruberin hydratase
MSFRATDIVHNLRQNKKMVIIFFSVFYTVGFFGTIMPSTHNLIGKLFPLALLLSFSGILLFNDQKFDMKTILVLVITTISGFFIEVAGVKSHIIFGSYSYGDALGIKILDTPLMIGINWAMLVFATGSAVEELNISPILKIVTASALMVLYDLVMESIAPVLDMWTWAEGIIPVKNFIAWFIIALLLHSLFRILKVKPGSSMGLPVLYCQSAFFILLIVFFK